MTKDERITVDK